MLALLLVLLMANPPQVGQVHILVESGDTIFIDGHQIGLSSAAAGGMLIDNIIAGEHEIFVRTPSGGRATAKVTVYPNQTATVSISSLGLRTRARGNDSTIELQVAPTTLKCEMVIGYDRVTAAPDELRLEHIQPGPQKVSVTCGDKQASADLEIPAGRVVTLQADLPAHKIHVVGQRERVTAVVVPSVDDKIMRLDLPFTWKRAIAASITPGVQPRSIQQKDGTRVEAQFVAASYSAGDELASRLRERPEVEAVYVSALNYTRDGGATMTLSIIFRGGE